MATSLSAAGGNNLERIFHEAVAARGTSGDPSIFAGKHIAANFELNDFEMRDAKIGVEMAVDKLAKQLAAHTPKNCSGCSFMRLRLEQSRDSDSIDAMSGFRMVRMATRATTRFSAEVACASRPSACPRPATVRVPAVPFFDPKDCFLSSPEDFNREYMASFRSRDGDYMMPAAPREKSSAPQTKPALVW